jgi:hypothetical protein
VLEEVGAHAGQAVQQVVLGERREFRACDAGVAVVNAAVGQRGDVRVKRRQADP